jgi:hypothetical protein
MKVGTGFTKTRCDNKKIDRRAIKRKRSPFQPEATMIYILAALLPPLGLLLNGQPFSALFNLVLIVVCILLTVLTIFSFPFILLLPSIHGIIAVAMKREQRRHREIVEAIERHGPPPAWRP